MTVLGKLIQDRRGELNLTLAQLSEITGLLPQTINAIERGTSRTPRSENLRKLAQALQLPVSDLADAAYAEAVPV